MHTRMRTTRDERFVLVKEQEDSGKPAPVICQDRGTGYQNILIWKKTMATERVKAGGAFAGGGIRQNGRCSPCGVANWRTRRTPNALNVRDIR